MICFILLTLAPFNQNANYQKAGVKWINVSYSEYIGLLSKTYTKKNSKSVVGYKKELIKDYINFTQNLTTLVNNYWLKEDSYNMFNADEKMAELRIDDIRQKIIYSQFTQELCEKLKDDYNIVQGMTYNDHKKCINDKDKMLEAIKSCKNNNKPILFVNSSYGLQGGISEIKLYTAKDIVNGKLAQTWIIQVQPGTYRIGLEKYNGYKGLTKDKISKKNKKNVFDALFENVHEELKIEHPFFKKVTEESSSVLNNLGKN